MFSKIDRQDGLDVQMSAELLNIDSADHAVTEAMERWQLPIDAFAVRLLLREALMNAVIHGSGKDPRRHVTMHVTFDEKELRLNVIDSGPGFDWQMRLKEGFDVLSDGGRGMALMQIYASHVEYNAAGNELTLGRAFEAPPVEASCDEPQESTVH